MYASSSHAKVHGPHFQPVWRRIAGAVIGAPRATYRWVHRTMRRWRAQAELMALLDLSDRELEGIGLPRYVLLSTLAENTPLREGGS